MIKEEDVRKIVREEQHELIKAVIALAMAFIGVVQLFPMSAGYPDKWDIVIISTLLMLYSSFLATVILMCKRWGI